MPSETLKEVDVPINKLEEVFPIIKMKAQIPRTMHDNSINKDLFLMDDIRKRKIIEIKATKRKSGSFSMVKIFNGMPAIIRLGRKIRKEGLIKPEIIKNIPNLSIPPIVLKSLPI
ncbi:hypothetical protein IWB18_10390 [Alkalibacter sp. M17DMB]|nr:hypothetical protein [Alkalibacter mobilis]